MKNLFLLGLMSLFLIGCATTRSPRISQYDIEQKIIKGKTTKQEILEFFGPPNIVTKSADIMPKIDYGNTGIKVEMPPSMTAEETWTYYDISTSIKGSYGSAVLFGIFGASTSSKTVMLMIYFDKEDKVLDYSITTSQF